MSPALTGSAVSFSAGTKTISLVAPAAKLIQEDDNGDLSVTRNLAVGGYVAAASARAAAFYFDLSATLPFGYQVAGYTVVYDGSARAALHMGGTGDPTNYYRNTTHYFQSVAGGANFAIMNSTGLAVSGVVDA